MSLICLIYILVLNFWVGLTSRPSLHGHDYAGPGRQLLFNKTGNLDYVDAGKHHIKLDYVKSGKHHIKAMEKIMGVKGNNSTGMDYAPKTGK